MSKFFYFKVTFLTISAGLFAGTFVYGLFDINFSDTDAIIRLLWKSLATAIGTGLVLGFLNMFFKIGSFPNKNKNLDKETKPEQKHN